MSCGLVTIETKFSDNSFFFKSPNFCEYNLLGIFWAFLEHKLSLFNMPKNKMIIMVAKVTNIQYTNIHTINQEIMSEKHIHSNQFFKWNQWFTGNYNI